MARKRVKVKNLGEFPDAIVFNPDFPNQDNPTYDPNVDPLGGITGGVSVDSTDTGQANKKSSTFNIGTFLLILSMSAFAYYVINNYKKWQ